MEKLTVERSIWIDAPRERVWKAITDDKQIMQWWGDYWEIPRLEVGATIKFGANNEEFNGMMEATIEVLDPRRQFSIHWPPQEIYHSITVLTIFKLEEENGGTRVNVSETGFEALPDDIRQKRYAGTGEGYTRVLTSLKALLEQEKA